MTARGRLGIAAGSGLAYVTAYLFMVGDLTFGGYAGWGVRVARNWSELWLQARSLFQFEGIAMLEGGVATLIVSPLNLLIAGALGLLVAANVHGALALRQAPAQCNVSGSGAGLLAAAPALLAGGACCAPALLLLIGLPSLGAFAGLFGWLIPLAFGLLIASRWWQRRLGAPRLVPVTASHP